MKPWWPEETKNFWPVVYLNIFYIIFYIVLICQQFYVPLIFQCTSCDTKMCFSLWSEMCWNSHIGRFCSKKTTEPKNLSHREAYQGQVCPPSLSLFLRKVWFITNIIHKLCLFIHALTSWLFISNGLTLQIVSAVLPALALTCDRPHKAPYKSVQKPEMTAAQPGRSPQSHRYCPLWASIS